MNTLTTQSGRSYQRVGDAIERRAELVEAMRHTLDTAKRERRDLTPTEAREWDTCEREADELTKAIREKGDGPPAFASGSGEFRSVDEETGEVVTRGRRRTGRSLTPAQGAAMRAIEARHLDLSAAAGDRLAAHIERDRRGDDARYISAVANPAYRTAFFKSVFGLEGAGRSLTAPEAEAMEAVGEATQMRAMANSPRRCRISSVGGANQAASILV
jgi:hypothetical protein